jgi:bacillopeptidase F (M6 metalloprotease family)
VSFRDLWGFGIAKSRVTSAQLDSSVNLDNPRAYAADGAPANGTDYVLARNGTGKALNGDAADWATQTFDLSAYAGKSILVGFRYVSDGGVNDGDWSVDNVKVGDILINDGTTTEPFKSTTQVLPVSVFNWNVRVIALDAGKGRAVVRQFGANSFSLTRRNWRASPATSSGSCRSPTTSRPSSTNHGRCTGSP